MIKSDPKENASASCMKRTISERDSINEFEEFTLYLYDLLDRVRTEQDWSKKETMLQQKIQEKRSDNIKHYKCLSRSGYYLSKLSPPASEEEKFKEYLNNIEDGLTYDLKNYRIVSGVVTKTPYQIETDPLFERIAWKQRVRILLGELNAERRKDERAQRLYRDTVPWESYDEERDKVMPSITEYKSNINELKEELLDRMLDSEGKYTSAKLQSDGTQRKGDNNPNRKLQTANEAQINILRRRIEHRQGRVEDSQRKYINMELTNRPADKDALEQRIRDAVSRMTDILCAIREIERKYQKGVCVSVADRKVFTLNLFTSG
jgi:hypothetical protein